MFRSLFEKKIDSLQECQHYIAVTYFEQVFIDLHAHCMSMKKNVYNNTIVFILSKFEQNIPLNFAHIIYSQI